MDLEEHNSNCIRKSSTKKKNCWSLALIISSAQFDLTFLSIGKVTVISAGKKSCLTSSLRMKEEPHLRSYTINVNHKSRGSNTILFILLKNLKLKSQGFKTLARQLYNQATDWEIEYLHQLGSYIFNQMSLWLAFLAYRMFPVLSSTLSFAATLMSISKFLTLELSCKTPQGPQSLPVSYQIIIFSHSGI